MQRLRESLALVLLALLPFHAFGVTVLTRVIAGPGHAPLPILALWKEALLGVILLVALVEILRKRQWSAFRVDLIDALILALIALSVILLTLGYPPSFGSYALGVKYDFVPLVAFLILRRAEWSEGFRARVMQVILWAGGIVAAYGILTMVLPLRFFTALGYSDLHSLYVPGGPLAAFQQLGGSALRRMQSVMSGPNQLGLWLLIPLSVCWLRVLSERRLANVLLFVLCTSALVLTFSRAAWIAAAVVLCVGASQSVPGAMRRRVMGSIAGVLLVGFVLILAFNPAIILRPFSSSGHVERPLHAMRTIMEHPLGLGMGTAGPASNRTSDACVFLEAGADASWAADRPDLCVFVSDQQVQPTDRTCSCPFLTENWYLQLGVELGVLGFVLFLALTLVMLKRLRTHATNAATSHPAFLMFLGLSIASLFLHAWEDSAAAWMVWILIAMGVQRSMQLRR